MKNNIVSFTLIVLLTACTLQFSACTKKEGCTDPKALNYDPDAETSSNDCKYATTPPANTQGTLALHMHQSFGSSALDTSAVYTLNNGQKFRMNQIRYYLSNFALVKSDGTEVPVPESYLLIQPSVDEYTAGEAEAGTYTKIKFYIGIDSATNSGGTLPVDRPAGHPLALQTPSMFWTWASGYIFMRFEGMADTTGTSSLNQMFAWHIGSNSLRRTVEVPINSFTITAGQTSVVHLNADLNEIVKLIDFRTENMTHTMGNMPLAQKIANAAAIMFSEE